MSNPSPATRHAAPTAHSESQNGVRGSDVDASALILAKLDHLEQRLDRYEALLSQVPPLLGVMGDTVDGWMAEVNRSGLSLDERLRQAIPLLMALTEPRTVEALRTLVELAPRLADMATQAPVLIATIADTGDEMLTRLAASGINLDELARRGAHAAKSLVASQVLEDAPVAVISNAARALAESATSARPISLFGLMRALGDPEVQRTLGFAIAFARSFGSRYPAQAS